MSYPTPIDVARGIARGCRAIHKFGQNSAVDSTFRPVAPGGIYRTPQPSGATALRAKAGGSALNITGSSGAWQVTLIGLDPNGYEITDTITMNGASASAPTSLQFIRLFRAYVSQSGTYATVLAGSHVGAITIENAAGTEDWTTIQDTTIARGQSQIAVYSVPRNKSVIITGMNISCEADKHANIVLLQRQNILQTSPPYSAIRILEEFPESAGLNDITFAAPIGPIPELTDIGFMARATASTIDVTVSFDMLEFIP